MNNVDKKIKVYVIYEIGNYETVRHVVEVRKSYYEATNCLKKYGFSEIKEQEISVGMYDMLFNRINYVLW